jgi:hypothetical protein
LPVVTDANATNANARGCLGFASSQRRQFHPRRPANAPSSAEDYGGSEGGTQSTTRPNSHFAGLDVIPTARLASLFAARNYGFLFSVGILQQSIVRKQKTLHTVASEAFGKY